MRRKINSQELIIELDNVPHLLTKATSVLIQELSAIIEEILHVTAGNFIQPG